MERRRSQRLVDERNDLSDFDPSIETCLQSRMNVSTSLSISSCLSLTGAVLLEEIGMKSLINPLVSSVSETLNFNITEVYRGIPQTKAESSCPAWMDAMISPV